MKTENDVRVKEYWQLPIGNYIAQMLRDKGIDINDEIAEKFFAYSVKSFYPN